MYPDLLDVWDLFAMLRVNAHSPRIELADIVAGLDLIGVRDLPTRLEYTELVQALDDTWVSWQRSSAPE